MVRVGARGKQVASCSGLYLYHGSSGWLSLAGQHPRTGKRHRTRSHSLGLTCATAAPRRLDDPGGGHRGFRHRSSHIGRRRTATHPLPWLQTEIQSKLEFGLNPNPHRHLSGSLRGVSGHHRRGQGAGRVCSGRRLRNLWRDQTPGRALAHASSRRYCLGLCDVDGGNPKGQRAARGWGGLRGHGHAVGQGRGPDRPGLREVNHTTGPTAYLRRCLECVPELLGKESPRLDRKKCLRTEGSRARRQAPGVSRASGPTPQRPFRSIRMKRLPSPSGRGRSPCPGGT